MNEEGTRRYMRVWGKASDEGRIKIASYRKQMNAVLMRLIYEGAMNYMSAKDMASELGVSPRAMRAALRAAGLPTRVDKRLLADSAAKALRENAEALGVKPWQMDLMSPLAYLPMGDAMKRSLLAETTQGVTEFPETLEEQQ
jgi:hypothetical protein